MKNVYLIHGYTASPEDHWFIWLAQELESLGIPYNRLAMPNSNNPVPEEWLSHLEHNVKIDDDTVIIGHSLGCITWLNFLANTDVAPRGAVFVSGFYQALHTIPELTPFVEYYTNAPPVKKLNATVISALDDNIVPHQYSDALAQHLQADYIRLNNGGHFLDREGWTTFPLILDLVKKQFFNV